jgi:hypothetical protein
MSVQSFDHFGGAELLRTVGATETIEGDHNTFGRSGHCKLQRLCRLCASRKDRSGSIARQALGAGSQRIVNAVSIFLTCAEVKFPRRRVAVISRLDDLGLHFWVVDRGGAAAVPGLAS